MYLPNSRRAAADRRAAPIRVVILASEALVREVASTAAPLSAAARETVAQRLSRLVPGAAVEPYLADEDLRSVRSGPLLRYFSIEVPSREEGQALARRLRALDGIEAGYVESGPTPPPANPLDDPRSVNQGYLDAAPTGIDARWAWSRTEGKGVLLVDMEQGWTLDHDDLIDADITLVSGVNQAFEDHGTAVLGELVAVDNTGFGIGIAPKARCRVVSQWRSATQYGTAAAILSAGRVMGPGDVLLLEAQAGAGGTVTNAAGVAFASEYLPVEIERAVFDAIRHVTDQGVVVIEAAGNGAWTSFDGAGNDIRAGIDLDAWSDPADGTILNRNSSDFRDSGAIIVGAATSTVPHGRMGFSNHGSRIDCFGWGENVYTLGYGAGAATSRETFGFSGTSSASPIVAGAAILFQSWIMSMHSGVRHHAPYTPAALRELLGDAGLNTASAQPALDRIGVMPDLRRIIETVADRLEKVRLPEGVFRNYLTARVLIGLLDDTPGLVWEPWKKPVPVDPGWGPAGRLIGTHKRELVTSMAAHELALTLGKGPAQTRLASAALEVMREAVDAMERQHGG